MGISRRVNRLVSSLDCKTLQSKQYFDRIFPFGFLLTQFQILFAFFGFCKSIFFSSRAFITLISTVIKFVLNYYVPCIVKLCKDSAEKYCELRINRIIISNINRRKVSKVVRKNGIFYASKKILNQKTLFLIYFISCII